MNDLTRVLTGKHQPKYIMVKISCGWWDDENDIPGNPLHRKPALSDGQIGGAHSQGLVFISTSYQSRLENLTVIQNYGHDKN